MQRKPLSGRVWVLWRTLLEGNHSFIGYVLPLYGQICVGIVIYSKGWPEIQICDNEINVRPSYYGTQGLYNNGALIGPTEAL